MTKRTACLVALGATVLSFALATSAPAQTVRVGANYKLDSDPSKFRGRDQVGLAVHRTDPQRLVGINANYLDLRCEASASTDGGATWSTAVPLVPPAGHSARCAFHQSVTFGTGLNVYAIVTASRTNVAFPDSSVIVYRSTNGGATWQTGVVAMLGGEGDNDASAPPGSAGPFYQRPAVVVQPGAGTGGADRVYAVARDFIGTGNGACPGGCDVQKVAVSNDGGQTFGAPVQASPSGTDAADPAPATVNSDGSVTVVWRTAGRDGILQAARSTDQGQTWSSPIDIAAVKNRARFGVDNTHLAPPPAGPNSTTSTFPRMAADPTRPGWIYLVYGDVASGPTAPPGGFLGTDHFINYDQQIFFQRSKDNGLTWSVPKQVSDPTTYPGARTIQTRHPNVSVSPNGRVNVVWHDRRHWFQGPGERNCTHSHIFCEDIRLGDTYLSHSTNGGDTFSANIRVTDRSHNNDVGYDTRPASGYWSWGPVSAPVGNSQLLVGWMDSREGNWDTDTEDFYLARVDFNASGAAPRTVIEEPSGVPTSVRLAKLAYPAGNEGALVGGTRDPANQGLAAPVPGGPASRNASAIVIANASDVAGAMAGTVLARANPAPVLLSAASGLSTAVKDEITRIRPARVYLIGDTTKLSAAVANEAQLAAGVISQVQRVDGGSDAGTAAAIAALLDYRTAAEKDNTNPALLPAFDAAVIANPGSPDAAAAVGLAAARRLPMLYVEQNSVPAATATALGTTALDIDKTLVIGGPSVISDAVMGALPNPTRLGGANQYATSAAVVAESKSRGMPDNVVYVADGSKPMDATMLAGVVARATGMLVLSPPPVQSTAATTLANAGLTSPARVFVLEPAADVPPPPPPPPAAVPPPPPPPPPPAVTPPPPPAAGDTTAPLARLSGPRIQKIGRGAVVIGITCTSEPCTAVARATITVPRIGRTRAKTYTLRSVSARLAKNARRTVRLRISSTTRTRALRALRQRRSVSARFTVTVSDSAGNKRTLRRTVKFRR